MNILGVGPLELLLVLLIVFLVLGPKDMVSVGKKLGRFLGSVRKSEMWGGVTRVSKTIQDLPDTLVREAELEDIKKEIEQNAKQLKNVSKGFHPDRMRAIKAEIEAGMDIKVDLKDTPSIPETPDKI